MDPPSPGLGLENRRRVAVACLFNLLFATPPPPPSKRKLIDDDDDDFLSDRRPDDDDFLSELVRAYEVVRKSSGRIRPLYNLLDLPRPEASLWSRVQANRRDEGYMNLTGLPVAEFDRLATVFHLQYIEEVQRRKPVGTSNRGRPRNCSSSDVLALTLA